MDNRTSGTNSANGRLVSRRISRRAVLGGAAALTFLPILQACASNTPAGNTPGASTGTTPSTAASPAASAASPTTGATSAAGSPTAGATAAASPSAAATTGGTPAATAATTAVAGTPMAGTPSAGTPAAGTPVSGTPAAGTPAAGTPAAGAAGTPMASPTAMKNIGGSVSVLATWGGDEQAAFLAMVKPFEDQAGVKVQYEANKDLGTILQTRVSGGNPPDTAGIPGPGQMATFAKAGKLIDLSTFLDMNGMKSQYTDAWLSLAQVDGKQVGIFIKAAAKGQIWYNTKTFQQGGFQQPKTWDDLITLSKQIADKGVTPWSIGFNAGGDSGWPGTDWLEDIILRQSGVEVYDQWWQGKIKWTSDPIKKAWQSWQVIVGDPKMVYGGSQKILSTDYKLEPQPVFANPPMAYLIHEANFVTGFITAINKDLKPVTDFNYFPFPDIDTKNSGVLEVAGDLFGMFKDTPQARGLISWLTTPEAQSIWVKKGGALSPNQKVSPDDYPDPISKQIAQNMTGAKTVRFDGSDLMPNAMNKAFFQAVLKFVQTPANLDTILKDLDNTQASAYKS